MIVNHVKTKAMLFGKQHEFRVTYNGEAVEVVQSYRYLGNVVQHIQKQNGDIYSNTHEHLSEKGRKACFSLQHRLRQFNDISPSIMCNMHEALVSPVLTYGSDVWGHLKICRDAADSVFFKVVVDVLLTISGQFDSYVILYKMQAIQHCKKIQYQQHTHKNRQ